MNTNILPIALLVFFVILFVWKAAAESASDHAAMKDYKTDIRLHPYQHDYIPIPQNEISEFYKSSAAVAAAGVK
jgi:hypothetical protein